MKSLLLILSIAFAWSPALAQYKTLDSGSSVSFKIKNFGFNTSGSFKGLDGNIRFDPDNFAAASFDVSVDARTINTDNSMRDSHLQEDSYLDVKNYPRIRFISDQVTASHKKETLIISGKLTIKNHTKVISFPFVATAINGGFLFKGSFSVDRRDFGVGGSVTLSDNLDVFLVVSAKRL